MSEEAVKPKAAEPAATWVGDDGVTKEELEGLDRWDFT